MLLLDANVLLELLVPGRINKDAMLDWLDNNQEDFTITMLSVHLVLHFGFKEGLSLDKITTFLADYPKEPLLPEDYELSIKLLKGSDHEDAMQLAVAQRLGCDAIVTFDQNFAKLYANKFKFVNPK